MKTGGSQVGTTAGLVLADGIAFWEHPSIALAVSWAGMIAGTFGLFHSGVSVGVWHAPGWIALYFVVLGCLEWCNRPDNGLRAAIILGSLRGIPTFLFAVIAVVASGRLIDFSVDGISTHQDPVMAMMLGWNPVKDPFFSEVASIVGDGGVNPELVYGRVQRGSVLSFSSVTAAVVGTCTGNHESGKAINLIVIPMVFGFAYGCCRRFGVSASWSCFWSLAVSANPVLLYQMASFLQDGLMSAFFGCLLLFAVSWLNGSVSRSSIWIPTCLGLVLSGLKLSGMGYAGISLGCLGLGALLLHRMRFRMLLFWGILSVVLILWAGDASRFWPVSSRIGGSVSTRVSDYSSDRVIEGGGGFGQVEGLSSRSKIMQFVLSLGSFTHPSPTRSDFKIPFTVRRDELMTFYHLSGEPRAGGFGPMGSGILLLSALAVATSILPLRKRSAGLLFAGLMAILPLFFVPVFWARWIGHLWVCFLLAGLPSLARQESIVDCPGRPLPLFRLFPARELGVFCARGLIAVACLNALLVSGPYLSGHIVAGRILRAQLEVIHNLDQPVTAFVGWSGASRFWMIREGIAFNRDYLVGVPYSRLFRSESRVFLPHDVLDLQFDSTRTIRTRMLEIQAMSKRLQPGQFYAEIIFFPDDA